MIITQHEGFEVIAYGVRGGAGLIIGGKIGPIFRTAIDAVDWAYDTQLGADIPQGYDIQPESGLFAKLGQIAFQQAIKERKATGNGKGN